MIPRLILLFSFFGGWCCPQAAESGTDVAVLIEVIELDEIRSQEFRSEMSTNPDIHTRATDWVASGKAELIECTYLRGENLQRIEQCSRLEVMYGTSGDPPEVPNEFRADAANGNLKATLMCSTSFESDYEGVWHETDLWIRGQFAEGEVLPGAVPVNAADRGKESVSLSSNLITWSLLKEKESYASDRDDVLQKPLALKWMPRFARIRIPNENTLKPDAPALLQIVPSPRDPKRHVLVFATAWILRDAR